MTDSQKKPCITCKKVCEPLQKNTFPSLVSDYGTIFSSLGLRPNTKFHTSLMTKRHADDLRDLTNQEWEDILKVLKSDINKIENYYKFKDKPGPLGYRISIPIGEKGSQNMPQHFYVRVVPKYKEGKGTVSVPTNMKFDPSPDFAEHQKKLQTSFQPDQNGMIAEKSKIIAKFHDDPNLIPTFTNERLTSVLSIYTKSHLPNDINVIDQETWNEIGQMLKELMKKMEDADACHDFIVQIILGKEAAKTFKKEAELPVHTPFQEEEIMITLVPKFKSIRWWKGERPIKDNKVFGSMENERLAFKLNNPEEYAKEWGKKSTPSLRDREESTNSPTKTPSSETFSARESLWKQPSTYLIFASGMGIALLGLGIYWLLNQKNKAK